MKRYTNEEKSLKRFLKRKIKITFGLVISFLITGAVSFGIEYTETLTVDNQYYSNIKAEDNGEIIYNFTKGDSIKVEDKDYGIKLSNIDKKIIIKNLSEINVKIEDSNNDVFRTGIDSSIDNLVIDAEDITVYATSLNDEKIASSRGMNIRYGRTEKGTGNITIASKSNYHASAVGIVLSVGELTMRDGDIRVFSTGLGNLVAIGIEFYGGTITAGIINIDTKISGNIATTGKDVGSESIGIKAFIDMNNNGVINIAGGSIISRAENIVNNENTKVYSIYNTVYDNRWDEDSVININKDTSNDVAIYGDILNGSYGTINLNMNTKDSVFTGLVDNSGTVNLNLENGAVWNNKKAYHDISESKITTLTLNGGIINNDSVKNSITVDTLKGNGGTFNMKAEMNEATGKAVSGKLTFENITEKNTKFGINYFGNEETDSSKVEQYFNDLAKKIIIENGAFTANAKLTEGFITPEYSAKFIKAEDEKYITVKDIVEIKPENLNSMVKGMRDLATINLLTWRQEMNSLNKRMGELRNSTGEHGVWSRVYAGKIENGSQYDNEYQSYQVGYDKKYLVDNGTVFVGALVSYTDGETNYKLGSGENYSVGAGVYATWLNNDGQFADVILKQSRLHNKFDVTSKNGDKSQHGDYNNWGTSLSGQYGKRFDLNEKFFVEPSMELTLGRVDSADYTTSADVKVHQDSMYSLIGNIGTAVGYKFSDKGNIYARASLVKEFQGDIDTEYTKDGALEKTNEDLSDTWAEFGVGANYRFAENFNVYVDIEKTGDAAVDTDWQGNLGFRYEF